MTLLVLVAFLFVLPQHSFAQRGGRGGGGGTGRTTTGGGNVPPEAPGIADFKKAVAMQATTLQSQEFHNVEQDMATGMTKLLEVQQQSSTLKDDREFQHKLDDALSTLRITQRDYDDFIATFNKVQKDGFKELQKKLKKADDDFNKPHLALTEYSKRDKLQRDHVSTLAIAIQGKLTEFQSTFADLGKQMAIPPKDDSAKQDPEKQ